MQSGSDQKEESEKQVFLRLRTDRNPAVRKMRTGIPQSHMGEKRKKEDCLERLNRLTNGEKKCGDSETPEEEALYRAVMEAIHRITRNDGDFVGAFRQNVIRVIGNYGKEQELDEYEDKIKAKQQEMVALIAENAKTGSYT